MDARRKLRQALFDIFGDQTMVNRFVIVEGTNENTWVVLYEGVELFTIPEYNINMLNEENRLVEYIRPYFQSLNEGD